MLIKKILPSPASGNICFGGVTTSQRARTSWHPCAFALVLLVSTITHSQTSSVTDVGLNRTPRSSDVSAGQAFPYRPKDGDKLGYSKEESYTRLAPEIRDFLDGILRLYREPGLFASRKEVFSSIGAQPGQIKELSQPVPRISATEPFRQYAAPKGLFARIGWRVAYSYLGREENGMRWRVRLDIEIPSQPDCIDSRAVEGYLDLYLHANLDGKAHLVPPSQWDRHGASGGPLALPLSSVTPGIDLGFVGGCLVGIILGNSFYYREIKDDNVFNQ